jgi:ABC-type sugar transport system permease subunit
MNALRRSFDRRFSALAAAPAFAVIMIVTGVPLLANVVFSFTEFNPADFSFRWAGLANYSREESTSSSSVSGP